MKRQYEKPMLSVEYYALTQAIAACSGIKIGSTGSTCVLDDLDSTDQMKDYANSWGFLSSSTECSNLPLDGWLDDSGTDRICYHTNANAAFTSG